MGVHGLLAGVHGSPIGSCGYLPWNSIGIHGHPVSLRGFPSVSHPVHHVSAMGAPWPSHGAPIGLPWVSHGSPMRVPSDSGGLPLVCHRSPLGLPWVSQQSAMGFRGPPMGLAWVLHVSATGNPMSSPRENPSEIRRSRNSSRENQQNSVDCWMYGCVCCSFMRSSPEEPYTDLTIPRKTHANGRRPPIFPL